MRIVGISGNITRPSRTRLIVERVLRAAAESGLGETECFDVVDAGPTLGTTVSRNGAAPDLDRIWTAIETCDALVVGSPVYKSSYSGMIKHLFDLLDKDALRDRPVLLAATGRLPDYGFMIDYHLRPLFAFFQANVVPGGVYACDRDFDQSGNLSADLDASVTLLVNRLKAATAGRA